MVYPNVVRREETGRWIHSFLRHLFPFLDRGPALYPIYNRHGNTSAEVCFKSILIPSTAIDAKPTRSFENHFLFEQNGWSKVPASSRCFHTQPLTVTILDRKGPRHFGNAFDLRNKIRSTLAGLGRTVWIRRVAFENSSFEHQVAAMQSSDVVISAHGAAVANTFFLRKGSLVVDVFPFGYYYSGFERAGQSWFDVDFLWLVSAPDSKVFHSRLDAQPVEEFPIERSRERVRRAYNRSAQHFSSVGYPDVLESYWTKDVRTLNAELIARRPLKHQRLFPDPNVVAKKVETWYKRVCQ
eukprot:Plantae.Rhodophyta-Rhodochaete_pulchella.ctg36405.p2 GENE.Plantae.Rhodophyta-Rhodochaete_pulchella.ctg36405~~Plantae.Rhodophyta-Rhodochaete_pulchella.ctg36405.p2  ORF type:complete len:297 (-),score=23.12 Plantae.Rhodophyta-Rhodochaete_pulchella.ctg36405:68-958(-)